MPEGEVSARATGGEKNRSRNLSFATATVLLPADRGQKFDTTAANTFEMVAGSLAP